MCERERERWRWMETEGVGWRRQHMSWLFFLFPSTFYCSKKNYNQCSLSNIPTFILPRSPSISIKRPSLFAWLSPEFLTGSRYI